MATEIEYKFLVPEGFPADVFTSATRIFQGYLSTNPTVRIRLASNGQGRFAYMTVKGKRKGLSRKEYEFSIPADDALEMLDLCQLKVSKTRYYVNHAGNLWEVDVFDGDNTGLMIAELEVPSEDYKFTIPPWCGKDVSKVSKYTNASLARRPFKTWKKV